MPTINDEEFGTITIRRSAQARSVRIKVTPAGVLTVSMPLYTPVIFARRLIGRSRQQLRELLRHHHEHTLTYEDGMQIGKSHHLVVLSTVGPTKVERHKQQILVRLSEHEALSDAAVTAKIRPVVIAALRLEAKSYLPKRLSYLADQMDCDYERVRFSHAGSRWGSCSSSGTISLNIALMKLPFELIDYVLVHELAHTKELNHSPSFWHIVESADPYYKDHRRSLKDMTPSI